tara:strand:+ start:256 stop:498 length:243 start_codon:yes stop_codon:yes gene_type:complete
MMAINFTNKFELNFRDIEEFEQLKTAVIISRNDLKIKGINEDFLLARNDDASEVTLQINDNMLKNIIELLCFMSLGKGEE